MTADASADRLGRIGFWCYDHRRRVLAGWILSTGRPPKLVLAARARAHHRSRSPGAGLRGQSRGELALLQRASPRRDTGRQSA